MGAVNKMASTGQDKKLFTPGPLLCSATTKQAMLRDLGSRDIEFIETVEYIRHELLKVANVDPETWTTVPMQGSGTFAVEAVLQTVTPRKNGTVLILANGAYGKRMMKICDFCDISYDANVTSETRPVPLSEAKQWFAGNHKYDLIAIVHCETSSGVVNQVEEIASLAKKYQPEASVFVDAMSSFGAIPLNTKHVDYLVSSANKCLEGVPGFSYAICRKSKLFQCQGYSRSLSLDLVDQVKNLDATRQFRFTPPTHTLLAFKQALKEFWEEGGLDGRSKRYQENRNILKTELKKIGFKELVPDEHSSYIITSFLCPNDGKFQFKKFYERLSELDQVIYPGKVTDADTFRIGNIGHVFPEDMRHLIVCIKKVLQEMKVPVPIQYQSS